MNRLGLRMRALAALALLVAAGAAGPGRAFGDAPPAITGAIATTYNDVRVQFNEPVDPASIQPSDFALQMADKARTVDGATVTADASIVMLHSPNTWLPGQAGLLNLVAPGVVSSSGGQASTSTDQTHVGGAPGDFTPPVLSGLSISPARNVCFAAMRSSRCRHPGMSVDFRSTEDGFYFLTVLKGSRNLGSVKHISQPGDNFLVFDGKVRGRRLGHGSYKLVVSAVDVAGNVTPPQGQPSRKFSVK